MVKDGLSYNFQFLSFVCVIQNKTFCRQIISIFIHFFRTLFKTFVRINNTKLPYKKATKKGIKSTNRLTTLKIYRYIFYFPLLITLYNKMAFKDKINIVRVYYSITNSLNVENV